MYLGCVVFVNARAMVFASATGAAGSPDAVVATGGRRGACEQ